MEKSVSSPTYLPSLPALVLCVCVCVCALVGAANSLCWHKEISIPTQACISMMRESSANLGAGQAKKLGEIRLHYSPEANDLQRVGGGRGSTMHNSSLHILKSTCWNERGLSLSRLQTLQSPLTLSGLKLHQLSHLPKKKKKGTLEALSVQRNIKVWCGRLCHLLLY
jgi:hypothetical protein